LKPGIPDRHVYFAINNGGSQQLFFTVFALISACVSAGLAGECGLCLFGKDLKLPGKAADTQAGNTGPTFSEFTGTACRPAFRRFAAPGPRTPDPRNGSVCPDRRNNEPASCGQKPKKLRK